MIKLDLSNKRFGKLTAISSTTNRSDGNVVWKCVCDCGKACLVDSHSLARGNTRSCGCLHSLDLVGKRFGKLLVLDLVDTIGKKYYSCQCDCGNKTNVRTSHLTSGSISSCGCLRSDRALPYGESSFNSLYSIYQTGARKRNLDFKLNKERFRFLTKQNCYYCNSEPYLVIRRSRTNGTYTYMGIDRVDNHKGYIDGNVVPCCISCQRAKNSVSIPIMIRALEFLGYTITPKALL